MTAAGMPVEDPVDALVRRLGRIASTAVDPLQLAAVLESEGVTDRSAFDDYGQRDVFSLADLVFRRVPRETPADAPLPVARRDRHRTVRELLHGPLYVLPSAGYPAALAVLGARAMVLGMIYATAIGWVYSMGTSFVAYRLAGRRMNRAAARWLCWSGAVGLVLAAAGAVPVARAVHAGGVVLLAVCQMGFQLAAGALVFYGLEQLLVLSVLPGLLGGIGYLVLGRPPSLVAPVLVAAVASVVTVLAVAVRVALREGGDADPPGPLGLAKEARDALPVLGYAAVCAGYLLFTDGRFVLARTDLALAVAPLVLGMGLLEWRARRFGERSQALLDHTRYPAEFTLRVRLLLARSVGGGLLLLAVPAAVLLYALHGIGALQPTGVAMTAAHLLLGGVYLVGFLMINQGRTGSLLAVLAGVLVADVAATAAIAGGPAGFTGSAGGAGVVVVFLLSSLTLLVLLVVVLAAGIGQVRRYRW